MARLNEWYRVLTGDNATISSVKDATETSNEVYTINLKRALKDILEEYGLIGNKHIPSYLLRESRAVRMAL